MKRLLMVCVLACIFSVPVFADPELTASILKYEPSPAEQGNTVDVWVQLSNAGTQAQDVVLKFLPGFPFSLPEGQPAEVSVGALAATEAKVVKFTVFVDLNAPNGPRNMTFQYRHASSAWAELESALTLQTQDALLVIAGYELNPAPLVPGHASALTLKLRNTGRIGLKNIDASLGISGTAFSTVGAGSKQRVDRIGPGAEALLTFMLGADTDAEVRLHDVPVNFTYLDDRNKAYSDTARIGLIVNAEPELAVLVESTKFASKAGPGTVSLKAVNRGIVDLKYVTVRLLPSDDYALLSPSGESYIGNLDNDDFETVDFIIKPLAAEPVMDVEVAFKDPFNTDLRRSYSLPVRIITAKELGGSGPGAGTIILVLLALAGIAGWWLRRRKRK
jgi:hypothetical protein